ncbi:MAG: hypothetical protein AW07_02834 [Candidatus Accumulibacter sp. SK-11]|nr:MAG: hypothetical protein AW07_02834 [Candidatus Accumulibacter sp. SK-11]
MSEYKLHCEQFIAATRQHFFAAEPAVGGAPESREDDPACPCCRAGNRCHSAP